MGKYSVPKEIRDLKPKGTTIKAINNNYYVYESKSTSIKVVSDDGTTHWKTKTEYGKCIGKITKEDGFISNDKLSKDEITIFEYGTYVFAMANSSDVLDALKNVFHDDAEKIYCAALIIFVNGFTYIKDMSNLFNYSILSKKFPAVTVGKTSLDNLYTNLGSRTGKVKEFNQNLIDKSSKDIAVDGHVIACASEIGDLSEFGYKYKKINSRQMNYMSLYDVVNNKPLATEMFNGSCNDGSVFLIVYNRYKFVKATFIMDRSFNTEKNKSTIKNDSNFYITPMVSGRNDYKEVYGSIKFDKRRYFIFDTSDGPCQVYYYEYRSRTPGVRYIAYKNTFTEIKDRKAYLKNIELGISGYTEEGLVLEENNFGLILLETNDMDKSCNELYCKYKSRWGIETFYDYIDNELDFNSIYLNDYCKIQGLGFIIQVSGLIYHSIRKSITDKYKLSLKHVIKALKGIKVRKENGKWNLENYISKQKNLCKKMNFKLNTWK